MSRLPHQKKVKTRMRRPTKRAQLIADAVNVLCPYCGEPQPNHADGSEQWTATNFAALTQAIQACVACDERMQIGPDSKVMFQ